VNLMKRQGVTVYSSIKLSYFSLSSAILLFALTCFHQLATVSFPYLMAFIVSIFCSVSSFRYVAVYDSISNH
jgi:hypothetical protein